MNRMRTIISKGASLISVALILSLPLGGTLAHVSADTVLTSDTGCDIPADSTYGPGVHHPTGSSASTFVYQCADDQNPGKDNVGKWVSKYYVYDPDTRDTTSLSPITYTCNPSTGKYDYQSEVWSPGSQSYSLENDSTAKPPKTNAIVVACPAPKPAPVPTTSGSAGASGSAAAAQNTATAGNTGNGNSSTATNGTNNSTTNNNSNIGVTNNIGSVATSGNAAVLDTVKGGSATSGNAVTQANVINMLQSSSNAVGSGSNVATFTYNVDGDVNGDLLFDPSLIQNVQGDSSSNTNLDNNLTINNKSNATINNNLDLASQSGNATVADNVSGGDATSGNAATVVGIMNSIRSSIVAGKSFIGTININGNLNGNILLPANFVDTLMASNVPTVTVPGPGSTTTTNTSVTNKNTVTNTNNQGINNTVNSTATTGAAKVKDNVSGGSATTGTANTNVTAFNLTGSKVVAGNDVLVFVNVLGKWTGIIVGAPAGATAVSLGGNVTSNTTVDNSATLNNTTNQQINNNVNVSAASGDAKVHDNAQGGSAKSGDAQTAVNISNLEDSSLDLSGWFGILYINVFGTWNGNFGTDTSSNSVAAATASGNGNYLVGNASKLVRYTATSAKKQSAATTAPTAASTNNDQNISEGTVLAATTKTPSKTVAKAPTLQSKATGASAFTLPAIGLAISLAIFGGERLVSRRGK